MKWYSVQFDSNWVRCRNYRCRSEFQRESIFHKRKCPNCKMNNYGEIKEKGKSS